MPGGSRAHTILAGELYTYDAAAREPELEQRVADTQAAAAGQPKKKRSTREKSKNMALPTGVEPVFSD
jgi:hypothetical protein